MTKVFVHGNPETEHIWGPLIAALNDREVTDITTLSAPGFGAPVADGFDPRPENYVTWLAEEVAAIDGPVDIVGHDWGAGHVYGLLASQPDSVRSWSADCAGLLHPDYVWHDMAQTWQTPGAGEEAVEAMLAIGDEDRAAAYQGLGLPADVAVPMAQGFTADMGRCILDLYRAAQQPALVELGQRIQATDLPPGLIIDATADAYVAPELGRKMVEPLGAQQLTLEGNGHWWMTEDPETAAEGLRAFWASLDQ